MTISNIIDQITIEGRIIIRKIREEDTIEIYRTDECGGTGLQITKELKPYADMEIKYMYPILDIKSIREDAVEIGALVIEVE